MTSSASDYIVIASATAKPGKEAELEHALHAVAGPTRAQPGCIAFHLLRQAGVRATIIGFERWASEADHAKHVTGSHFQVLARRLAEILAEPPSIVAYEELDA
jgi:quinol monooxygenase YgiN